MIVSIDLYQFYCQTVRVIFKYMNINTNHLTIDADNRLTIKYIYFYCQPYFYLL